MRDSIPAAGDLYGFSSMWTASLKMGTGRVELVVGLFNLAPLEHLPSRRNGRFSYRLVGSSSPLSLKPYTAKETGHRQQENQQCP